MKIRILITAIAFSIIGSWVATSYCSDEDLYILKGSMEEKVGNFAIAAKEYEKALCENPKLIPVYYSLGRIYHHKMKQISEAIRVYKKGLELFQNDYGLHINIMNAYFDVGDIKNGIKHYTALSKISGANDRYSFPRDVLNKITGEITPDEIANFCEKFLKINPTDNILREVLSDYYMNVRNYVAAKRELEWMLSNGYETGSLYFNMGVCDYYLKNYSDSKMNLLKAKTLGERVPEPYFKMIDDELKKQRTHSAN